MVHAFNNENWESIDFLSHQTNTYYHTLFDIPKNHEIVPHQKKVSLRQVFSVINIEPPNMFFAPNRFCGLEAHTNVSNFDFHLFSLYSAYSWFNEYEFSETFEWSLPVVFDFTGTHQNVQLNGGTRTRFEQFQNTITKVHVVSDGIHNKDKVERLLRLLRDNNGIEMRAKHNTVDLTSSIMHSGHVSGNLISFASKHRLKEELKTLKGVNKERAKRLEKLNQAQQAEANRLQGKLEDLQNYQKKLRDEQEEDIQKLKKNEEEAHKNDPDVHIGDGDTITLFTPKLRL